MHSPNARRADRHEDGHHRVLGFDVSHILTDTLTSRRMGGVSGPDGGGRSEGAARDGRAEDRGGGRRAEHGDASWKEL